MNKDDVYRCAILISGKVLIFRQQQQSTPNPPFGWKYPCEMNVIPDDDGNIFVALRRIDMFNRDDKIQPPSKEQILSTYEPDDYLIAKYQDAVEQQAEQLSGAVQ